ncbi:MAG: hypothetical protein ASARMPRED_006306 [Alectoria sarmentosa]|nr:MAG: hypothetical protein ASARMPRED_006306 [Alectoria sarmentosa]
MENIDLVPLIELLDDNIDDLEEALEPLLKSALSDTARKLPLLDRAQLYVLVTYSIESILFSYLRLNDVNSKEHPVFRELTRVKQYFEKIKATESAETKQNVTLDKAAAGRFIKQALTGNKKLDLDLAKQKGKENAGTHTRFEEFPRKQKFNNAPVNGSRAVSSSDNPASDPEHLQSDGGPSSKRMKWQSSHDRRGSDGGTKAMSNGDPKAERKKKKSSKENRVPKETQGALDGD